MTITRIAADIGGTFTDIAALTEDGRIVTRKVPSTPGNYADAVVAGVRDLVLENRGELGELSEILHGCTVATNAILEFKGARTALITTLGFRDVLEMRRVRVPRLYDPLFEKPAPLVPRHLRFEVRERVDALGGVLTPLDEADVHAAILRMKQLDVEAVAVCLLHSYANPDHERRIGEIIRSEMPAAYLSLSIDVLPQKREYERTSTTVINSYVGPPVQRYLDSMIDQFRDRGVSARLMVMQSSGGVLDAQSVIRKPANIVECGPAAGVIGAQHLSRQSAYGDLITLDMGGTTAKASIIEKGVPIQSDEYEVGGGMSSSSPLAGGTGYALKLPVIDIAEVGAGGGSLAWIDEGGSLKVGPESAGSVPGPACYKAGNDRPTVTDANVVLGYINPQALAGGSVPIDAEAARRAVSDHVAGRLGRGVDESAFGIHLVANANMMRAVKAVTTYRGRDPRDFSLIAFGGSGGIHALDLARILQVRKVILPRAAGVFSAVGLLFSDLEASETAPFMCLAAAFDRDRANAVFERLADHVASIIGGDRGGIRFTHAADMRFSGQAFEITIPFRSDVVDEAAMSDLVADFTAEHVSRYGHDFGGRFDVEIVNLKLTGTRETEKARHIKPLARETAGGMVTRRAYFGPGNGYIDTPIIDRTMIAAKPEAGPFIIEEYEGTAVVPPGWIVARDEWDSIVIEQAAK